MWRLLELLIAVFIVIAFFTEFLIPILRGKPLFGSFRGKSEDEVIEETVVDETTLEAKIEAAKSKVEEVKQTQSEISAHFKTAEQLKEDSDNLLNK